MSVPRVSVIVLAYNHASYLHDCLDSVIAQSGGIVLEILVGDDQSRDATPAIASAYADRHPGLVKHFRHERQLGPTGNYQFLVRQAQGEFTAYLDGDDFWLPGKLRAQLAFLDANPACPAVYGNALVVSDAGAPVGIFNNWQPGLIDIDYLVRHGNFLVNGSMVFRTASRAALLDVDDGLVDYRVHLGLARLGALGYINRVVTGYRQGSSSSSLVHANDNVRECTWYAIRDVAAGAVSPRALSSGMADFLRRVWMRSIRTRSPGLAYRWTRRVLADAPGNGASIFVRAAASLPLAIMREGLDWLATGVLRNRVKVLYRR